MGYEVYREREDYRWVLLRAHAVQRLQKNHKDNDDYDEDEDDQRIDVNKNITFDIFWPKQISVSISVNVLVSLHWGVWPIGIKALVLLKKIESHYRYQKKIGLASVLVSLGKQ